MRSINWCSCFVKESGVGRWTWGMSWSQYEGRDRGLAARSHQVHAQYMVLTGRLHLSHKTITEVLLKYACLACRTAL